MKLQELEIKLQTQDLESIAEPFAGILLDAYGVFWCGGDTGLLPGSKEAMARLVAKGKIVGVLSNTTQLAKNEIDKLQKHGLIQGQHYHFYITSGEVAKEMFSRDVSLFPTPNKKYYLFGEPHPKYMTHQGIFQETSFQETKELNEADFVYISIPHIGGVDQIDPAAFKTIIEGFKGITVPMVCANSDQFAHEGNPPRQVVRQGSIAKMHEEQGGSVIYIGKPSNMMFAAAMQTFADYGISLPQQLLMVGDTPETDIRGAQNAGIPSALITKTGITADRIADYGLDYLLTLPKQDTPDFFISRVGRP